MRKGMLPSVLLLLAQTLRAREPEALEEWLEQRREKAGFPALAAAVVRNNEVVAIGAAGLRKWGGTSRVTRDDKFHIGSCTKSMTAVLAAQFVERGKLRWSSTLAEVFPELSERMHVAFRGVTLEQLLAHQGGVPGDLTANGLWARLWLRQGTPREQRMVLLQAVTAQAPAAPPGQKFIYSNGGVAIAGAMLERVGKQDWETLMTENVFRPLGITNAGFGAPKIPPGSEEQPWWHVRAGDKTTAFPLNAMADNPPAIAPAGTVHCSIRDLARYILFHAHEMSPLLQPATFARIHDAPPGQVYGFGWNIVPRPWGGGKVLNHAGSNTKNYTVIWIAPKKDFGVAVETNVAGTDVESRCDEIVGQLVQRYLR